MKKKQDEVPKQAMREREPGQSVSDAVELDTYVVGMAKTNGANTTSVEDERSRCQQVIYILLLSLMSVRHTRKRQYQPSNQTTLNSYFGRHVSGNAQPRSPMSPALPEDVQSSLVNVGMRVRKAMSDAQSPKVYGSADACVLPASSAPVRIIPRQELQPFCGLHKTGGWAVQDVPPSSAPAAMRQCEDYDNEGMPSLSMSQSTIPSTQSSSMSTSSSLGAKKRTYEDEAENDMDAFFDESEDAVAQEPDALRPIARMKCRTGKNNAQILNDNGDFEEAPFLMPMDVQ
ncbi:uncharacterized protein MYCFIDRAFT_84488 [Pseudocercospora fijiensis CIRAD86]|uniref:Uncharacterized protein n=1 Tax=Pseudocercospora fijiensis (strain CIRAD86) TaxID=383855 RepID=M3BAK5_PSEFD|nr:uncharacterized protein MYCFIDRAFT_84488 [Pseudocercospora fijiensis CIRAD86]EME86342.1 hypothetical protein MYCFIDRAFT_84488 [Pseudocercospora fijiensis CIRAD86]